MTGLNDRGKPESVLANISFHPCVIIPIYNNDETIREVVESIAYLKVPCLIIDDGSNEKTRAMLKSVRASFDWVQVFFQIQNGGKGYAMEKGFREAFRQGFSHAVQMDADAQHNPLDVPLLLNAARCTPQALVLSVPLFVGDVPNLRRYGRWATHLWVWLETLSFDIKDALCGFRCYPLAAVDRLYGQTTIGHRMDFDPEIAVRLYWMGLPMINIETTVTYPVGGFSHFHYLKDNLRFVWLHTRLVVGMLRRIPKLLKRRLTNSPIKGGTYIPSDRKSREPDPRDPK